MAISVRESLMDTVGSPRFLAYLSDVSLEPEQIKTVMINEAVPLDPVEDFYGSALAPAYLETVFPAVSGGWVRDFQDRGTASHGHLPDECGKISETGYHCAEGAFGRKSSCVGNGAWLISKPADCNADG